MDTNFPNFKSNDINYRIALFDPRTNGMRYLKTLAYILASELSIALWKKLAKVKNRNIGRPISIKYKDFNVCLDYLQSIIELDFIECNIMKKKNLNILEIGSGYGRTCHTLLSNLSIGNYSIIEFGNYVLAKKYLRSVLNNKQFNKIDFFKFPNVPNNKIFDICVNIDSFGEISNELVTMYLKFIDEHCEYFYTKNMIGKFYDKTLDNHSRGKKEVKKALKTGPLRKIIDIFDESEIIKQKNAFIKAYKPGIRWNCITDSWAKPWSYYWQCIYRKDDRWDQNSIPKKS